MKKIKMCLILMISISFATACNATSAGDKGTNHIYKINEEIKIVDKGSDGELGTLEITKCEVIKNEPFILKVENGFTENSEPIYEDVEYTQVILISYNVSTTDSSKWVTSANFDTVGNHGEKGYYDADLNMNYGEKNSVVFAFKEATDVVKIEFNYKLLQMQPTAVIEVGL